MAPRFATRSNAVGTPQPFRPMGFVGMIVSVLRAGVAVIQALSNSALCP
jgi:hypothetical protein